MLKYAIIVAKRMTFLDPTILAYAPGEFLEVFLNLEKGLDTNEAWSHYFSFDLCVNNFLLNCLEYFFDQRIRQSVFPLVRLNIDEL